MGVPKPRVRQSEAALREAEQRYTRACEAFEDAEYDFRQASVVKRECHERLKLAEKDARAAREAAAIWY